MRILLPVLPILGLLLIASGCSETPSTSPTDGGQPPPDSGPPPMCARPDAGVPDAGPAVCIQATDYTPRESASSTDSWPACVSDMPGASGPYTPVPNTGISTIARVEAFEMLFAPGGLLAADREPTTADFTSARAIYETDQGLGSRVIRRTEEHLPAPAANNCQLGTVIAANLDYCVGPTQLSWFVREGFVNGMTGSGSARENAARIEAAITWFLMISPYKESLTCTTNSQDCNSAWAYYNGGINDRAGGIGFARLVRALDDETHQRIWDGLLAVRCWRDLDPGDLMMPATDLALRDRARAQLDRATDRGIALVLIDRLERLQSSTGTEQLAHLAWLRTLMARIPAHSIPNPDGGADIQVPERESLVDRMIRARNPAYADLIACEMSATSPGEIDVGLITGALRQLFNCP